MLNYIISNATWIVTFIIVDTIFFMFNYLLLKLKKQTILSPVINIIESAILITAVAYAGAPMWLILTIASLTVISIGSVMLLKLKYSL